MTEIELNEAENYKDDLHFVETIFEFVRRNTTFHDNCDDDDDNLCPYDPKNNGGFV